MATREENIERFENLMAAITRDGKDALMDYIKNKTDFYTAPASTQFHLSCEGGRLQHSLNVYDCLIAKKQALGEAMEKYPIVLALNEADLEASKLLEDVSGNKE